jgi:hypothetical protein
LIGDGIRYLYNEEMLVCRCQERHRSRRRQYLGSRRLETRCLGVALVKVRERVGLVWGKIGLIFQVFSCKERLIYWAVARFHSGVRGKDRVSLHGGDWWLMVMGQGLDMGKAVHGLCLHVYMLDLVWIELDTPTI